MVGVAARTVVTAGGWYYWDDLTLHSQARQFDAPTLELLLRNHDGHLMPGAWLIEWLLATVAPLNWPVAVGTLVLLQLLAAGAVAWACRVAAPGPIGRTGIPWAALPLAGYLLTPLTLPTTTWLATAVNILPLHVAFAMMLGHALLAWRRQGLHHQVLAVVWLVGGMLFSERALFLGPAVIFTLVCFSAATASLATQARRLGQLTIILALPTVVWAVVYLVVIGDPRETYSPPPSTGEAAPDGAATDVATLLSHGYLEGLLPTLGGGPWHWKRWHPGPPWADPSTLAVTAGAVALVLLLFWTSRRGWLAVLAWLPAALYPLAPLLALAIARTGPDTAVEITQTLRHFSEVAVLGAVTFAFLGRLPTPRPIPRPLTLAAPLVLLLVVVSAVVSTATYARVWWDQPARDYFQNLRPALAQREEPVFDQAVGLDVLLPVVHPHNQLSHLLGGLDGVPPITHHTTDPVFVDNAGQLQPARLEPMRSTVPGGDPGCGTRIGGAGATLELDGPLMDRDWVLLLNYFADAPGTAEVQLDEEPVQVPLQAGLNQVYVRLLGGGSQLTVTASDGTSELCVGDSDLGVLSPAG